jgi:uncharacterized protein YukE
MAVIGADVEHLRALAKTFTQAADRLERLVFETSRQLTGIRWVGPDAERYRTQWQSQSVHQVTGAAGALRAASSALQRNAEEQQTASAATGDVVSVGAQAGIGAGNTGGGAGTAVSTVTDGYRDFTAMTPIWPINVDTALSMVPGVKDVLPFVDGAALAADDRLSLGEKAGDSAQLAYDTLAGQVRSKAFETHDIPGYLLGVAMSQWGDVIHEGAKADFSAAGVQTVTDYIAADPGSAMDAAVSAVKDYLPKLASNFSFW